VSISSLVARPLLAGMFVYGGLDAFRNPGGKVPRAEKVAPDIAEAVGIDADTEQLVQFSPFRRPGDFRVAHDVGRYLSFQQCLQRRLK